MDVEQCLKRNVENMDVEECLYEKECRKLVTNMRGLIKRIVSKRCPWFVGNKKGYSIMYVQIAFRTDAKIIRFVEMS